jgi:hypothetical protein
MDHPHAHCVVTGGGLSPDRSRWIACKRSRRRKKWFFLPVTVLSRVFRGKFIDYLKRAFFARQLTLEGKSAFLSQPGAFEHLLNMSVRKDWTVYAKRPFGGPEQVLKYLARYTHRVAISNQRLVDLRNGQVRFRYKDYADGQKTKVLPLSSSEFIRRFLMHTLPTGFVRIRYYGLLANRHRRERLDLCRSLLGVKPEPGQTTEQPAELTETTDLPEKHEVCPICQRGRLVIVDTIPGERRPRRPFFLAPRPAPSQHLHGSSRSPPSR